MHGGYITVPAMHKINGKRHKIEIALSATSNGKHATYVIFGTNDDLAMDLKFLSNLGWEGLENSGHVDKMKVGDVLTAKKTLHAEEMRKGDKFYSYVG